MADDFSAHPGGLIRLTGLVSEGGLASLERCNHLPSPNVISYKRFQISFNFTLLNSIAVVRDIPDNALLLDGGYEVHAEGNG